MYYYVYILYSQKNRTKYVGFTSDLKKRVKEHNDGMTYSTKSGRPWKLIYYEAIPNKADAINREKYLKSGWGKQFISKTLSHYFTSLK
jgi:putative endonuclease